MDDMGFVDREEMKIAELEAENDRLRAGAHSDAEIIDMLQRELDQLNMDVSHWKFQAKAARLVCQMFVDEFDRSESTTINPTMELIDAARLHTKFLETRK